MIMVDLWCCCKPTPTKSATMVLFFQHRFVLFWTNAVLRPESAPTDLVSIVRDPRCLMTMTAFFTPRLISVRRSRASRKCSEWLLSIAAFTGFGHLILRKSYTVRSVTQHDTTCGRSRTPGTSTRSRRLAVVLDSTAGWDHPA